MTTQSHRCVGTLSGFFAFAVRQISHADFLDQVGADCSTQDAQHRRQQFRVNGERLLNGIGNDRTHWRTGTLGMILSTRYAAVLAMRHVPDDRQLPHP